MELSLKNYKTILPAELLKKAEKNKIRECDETEKGHFVAYVDENDESFDVSLVILPDKNISVHSCDCKSNGFCRHKTALLIHIVRGSKTKQGIKAKSTVSETEALLEAAEVNELKEWVSSLLIKNKDIELAFTHYFSAKKHQHNPEEVAQLTNKAIKAVVKNKKSIDPTQLKKIVELWSDIHLPVVQNYQANVADEKSFLCFHAILECCSSFQQKINTSSNRVYKYIEGLLQQSTECLSNLYDEAAWAIATGYFIKFIASDDDANIRMHYLLHLKNITGISSAERKVKMTRSLAAQYQNSFAEQNHNGTQYTKIIFGLVQELGLFADYYSKFKPIRFDNEFNKTLIHALIENNNTELAKKYCQLQIQNNFRDEYNVPYLELLKEIYTIEKDEGNLVKVLIELFPHTFNFDDFIYIYKWTQDEEERKKWRTKILTKARHSSHCYNKATTEFCFKLTDYEKNYKKMIDYIDSYTPYRIILTYFEQMILTDKARLLKALIDKSENYSWGSEYNDYHKDEECFPELFDITLKHYSADYLKKVINQTENNRFSFRLNRFLAYIREKLVSAAN
jgi:hypothetical protein